ncbi:hypothetical protein AB1484_35880 [Parafrankia sp. FMc6]|uniref:hypothetical protein n=1 Tax=Parafrankia soli TaxID=2599596 RepID=UPI0034D4DD8D
MGERLMTCGNAPGQAVHLLARYSNLPSLLTDLRTTYAVVTDKEDQEGEPGLAGLTGSGQVRRRHAITDRLPASDIESLINSYLAGATARSLAEKFSISLTAVKVLLRTRGIRRNSQPPDHT